MATGEPAEPAAPAAPAEGEEGDEGAALVERPAPDRLVRAVARARIADKLFARKQEVKLGRYHLLEMIGAGGMGVVWGAFDPELDRRVAIKLVKTERSAARERILAEGKALAKLSHPNVVTVHDVGVVDDQIYIVMEWVRGQNLRAYCKEPRTLREIVALYRAAGEGLSAAHRAGLVHRDFKPDNAMVGDDGRVRVLDFGLARGEVRVAGDSSGGSGGGGDSGAESSDLTRGAGTPRYMPPEQAEGQELTPAVDQYAFCVSLREAIAGRDGPDRQADVPRWLDELLARGTAREAAHRFASMDALLHALARDPATVWRRRLVAAGVVAAAGAAFAVGTLRAGGSPALERCGGGAGEIAKAWNDGARERMTAHLRGLGAYGAQEAVRLAGELSAYSARWAAAHRDACLAKERGELTAQLYERDLGCLARAHAALDTVVDVLQAVPAERLPSTVLASQALPDAAGCLTDAQTSTVDPPPAAVAAQVAALGNDVERANVLAVAADPRAIEAAEAAHRRAAELGYLPLVAAARLVHGRALTALQTWPRAIAALDEAVTQALEAGDPRLAVEAYARELYAIGITEREKLPAGVAERSGALPLVDAIAKQLGPRGGFQRALLYNNAGTARLAEGDREGARRWFEEARGVREATGASGVELASIWGNLAMVTPERERRDRLFAQKATELDRALGPDHPMTLDAWIHAAMFAETSRRAYELAREPCRRYRELHPHLGFRISHCALEVGWLAEELGDAAEARGWLQVVLASERRDTFERGLASGFLLLLDGRPDEAAAVLAALAETVRGHAQPWVRLKAVNAWIVGAAAELRAGRPARARASLERARELLEALPAIAALPYGQRRQARVRALLAGLP
jgi:tetratricopeptide (TPR) repeat protein